jgi:hypothetical protein
MNSTKSDSFNPRSSQTNFSQIGKPGTTLTKVEKAIIKETDGEYKRRGKFVRVFPSVDYNYYKQFFKEERFSNFMID